MTRKIALSCLLAVPTGCASPPAAPQQQVDIQPSQPSVDSQPAQQQFSKVPDYQQPFVEARGYVQQLQQDIQDARQGYSPYQTINANTLQGYEASRGK